MPRFVFAALLVSAVCVASTARADLPTPANSTIPLHVNLVGYGPAGPDSAMGQCEVIFRDLANSPIPGAQVDFYFADVGDMTIASDPLDPRLTVRCLPRIVSAVTDVNGRAVFTIVGAGIPGRPASTQFQFHVYADGVLLGSPTVSAFDLDGVGGVNMNDLALWFADYISGANPMRSDYDGSGGVTGADLSRWAAVYFGGGSTQSAASYCP